MRAYKHSIGFALLSVVLLIAILSLSSLALVNLYLTNTRASSVELQRVKVEQLLNSGVRFAALSLASPRVKVSVSAVPKDTLIYASPETNVDITIKNEAGFIDLLRSDKALLESALLSNGVSNVNLKKVTSLIHSLKDSDTKLSYRRLRERLQQTDVNTSALLNVVSLHNGQKGVNSSLATEQVLALIPKLSSTQRRRLLEQRNNKQPSLINNAVVSHHFTTDVSAYYRVTVSVVLYQKTYSRVQIIKMINQRGLLYEVQATL